MANIPLASLGLRLAMQSLQLLYYWLKYLQVATVICK